MGRARARGRVDIDDWTAPDLDRARELVRRSCTRGMRVDMITVRGDALFSSAAEVVADALRRLGYRVSPRTYPGFGAHFAYGSVADSAELAFNGWIQDYPAPSNFIRGLFACNPYFCDRATERRMRRALAVQARDPQAAIEQWARLERELVERAIAIPLVNPKEVVFVSNLTQSRGGASILFIVGLAGAIWSASGYIGAFIRASNSIWDVEEGRPIWKTIPLRLGITLVMLILLTATAVAVTVTGPLADKVGKLLGVGGAAVTAWDIAKWPVLIVVVSLMFSILYYAAPNVRQPGFRWVTLGGILAVIVWIIVSALFGIYVATSAHTTRRMARLARS
jgi:YihY family inner membrane protein